MAKAKTKVSKEEQATIELAEKCGRMAKSAGCPMDQVINFVSQGMVLQPKQWEMAAAARKCDYRCAECERAYENGWDIKSECKNCGPTAIGVGGARAGGKSAWMFAQIALDDCQRFKGLKFLLLRKSAKALREQIRDMLRKTCQPNTYNYREQAGTIEFPNGSFIVIGHFKDESEIDNYLGQEYDGIAIEELTTLTFDKWENLMSCLRSSKKGWRPRFYGAWNWGGIGHAWVKQVFYDPWIQKKESTTRYILATVADNRHNNPEYVNRLKSYVGWKYQSWYLGDPNFNAGAFFVNFRRDANVYPNEQTQFDPRKVARWFAGLDYGFSHPNAFTLCAETAEGDIFAVRTYSATETLIEDHAENIRDLLRLFNLDIGDLEFIAAGRDCFKVDKDGSTVDSEYQKHDIHLTPVHIDRVNAWSQMQELIGNSERGVRPKLFVHESCQDLIVQIETAQCDPKKPNDVLKMNADKETGEGGDDLLESLRNSLVMAYSSALTNARPLKMGGFESLSEPGSNGEVIDVDSQISESDRLELEKYS
jgi:phage terminase large subunit